MSESLFGPMGQFEYRSAFARDGRAGVRHQRNLRPGSPAPGQKPVITVTVGPGLPVDEVWCLISEPESAVVPLQRVRVEWDILQWAYVDVWQAELPAGQAGDLVRYQIRAFDRDSNEYYWADGGVTYSYVVGDTGRPAWAVPAIVYQIFPDRFYPGDGTPWNATNHLSEIHGGTIRGVIEKLDYIANLGFTAIWLNPFFPDETHHGYHATDYFSVNPRLGTLEDVRDLVDEAHARGLRLILDYVANHWGSEHETFRDARSNPASPYRDWYYWRQWPDDYVAYFNVPELPKLNVDNPAVRDHLLRSVAFWLGDVGFDGLRLDHADGPSIDFWTDVRAVARSVKPDVWMFGEVTTTTSDHWLAYEGLFDGTLDFLLAQALRATFGLGKMNLAEFDAFLGRHEAYFPDSFTMPSFLDNHDMDRFLWLSGGDKRRLKLAALCQFTLGGAPIVYNGTEVGVTQERFIHDPNSHGMEECRQPMLWGDDQDDDLYDYFWFLIHLRRQSPALWRGRRRTIHLDSEAGTYAYLCEEGTQRILVVFNLSEETRELGFVDPDIGVRYCFTLPPLSGDVAGI